MKTSRAILAGVIGVLAIGCELLAGIEDRTFTAQGPPDGGGPPPPPPPGPVCNAAVPPGPPPSSPSEPNGTYIFALRRLSLSGRDDAGVPVGFDLDGVCSCDPNEGRHDAGPSCVPPKDAIVAGGCDLDAGIDNGLTPLYEKLSSFPFVGSVDDILAGDTACGRQTLLIYLSGYNGQANDENVTVATLVSKGIRDEHEGGVVPLPDDAGCSDASAPYPAHWDGNDLWSVPSAQVTGITGQLVPLPERFLNGYVHDYQLVVDGRNIKGDQNTFSVSLAGQAMAAATPILVARLSPVDAAGNEVDAGDPRAVSFRIPQGVIGGRVGAGDFLSAIGAFTARGPDGGPEYFCEGDLYTLLYQNLKPKICNARDTRVDGRDFQGLPCDSMGVAFAFNGMPAKIGTAFDGTNEITGCAKDFHDDCDGGTD